MPAGYQIGTRAVRVELSIGTGPRVVGEMFLRPGGHGEPESVCDRLNDADAFFPLKQAEDAVLLVGKAQVRFAMAPPIDDEDPIAEARASMPQLLVTATLDDATEITGVLFVDLPPGHVRTLDYVNQPARAFVLIAQLDREYLVNRAFIRTLRDVKG